MERPTADDFTEFLDWDLDKLLHRLARVATTIVALSVLVAEAESREEEEKSRGWQASQETTLGARKESSRFAATSAVIVKLETKAQMSGLIEEKQFLTFLIDVRVRTGDLVRG